jgi:hypothetical protein
MMRDPGFWTCAGLANKLLPMANLKARAANDGLDGQAINARYAGTEKPPVCIH